ncbi:MAG: hypothetical protein II609_02760 [Muribaculaceae bacterium]|nr:hypothetical protein [Muribaculaceae bacterium]
MKAFKILIGIIFVVASLLKLAAMWNILHWGWFERVAEEPWAKYLAPVVLIIVGLDLIYTGMKKQRR